MNKMFSWLNFEELLIHNPIELINPSKDTISVAMNKKQYIEFFSNKYTYNGVYYNEEMDFCLFYYADPLQSYKEGDMYAQGYIDVEMKIYRVKWLCNVSIKLPFVAPETITAPMSQGSYLLVKDAKIYSGKDVTGTVYLDLTNCPCDVRIQFWSKQGMILGNFVKAGEKGYSRFSGKVPVLTGPSNIALYWKKTADPNLTFSYSEFKIEEGLTPPPYKHTAYAYSADGADRFSTIYPTTNADRPSYIGQYTDYTLEDSTNPSSYTWREAIGDKWNVSKTEMVVNAKNKTITTVLNGALAKCTKDKNITGWKNLPPNANYKYQQPQYSLDIGADDFIISGFGLRGLKNG